MGKKWKEKRKPTTRRLRANPLRSGRPATVISRVGDDELGREVLRRLQGRGKGRAGGGVAGNGKTVRAKPHQQLFDASSNPTTLTMDDCVGSFVWLPKKKKKKPHVKKIL